MKRVIAIVSTGTFTLKWTANGRAGAAETRVEMRNFTKQ